MASGKGFEKFAAENANAGKDCGLCSESLLLTGEKSAYGAIVVFRIGGMQDGWFATLSPRTGGEPEKDFTIQLMPCAHLTHFAQLARNPKLAENFGTAFARLSNAMTAIMAGENPNFKPIAESRETGEAI